MNISGKKPKVRRHQLDKEKKVLSFFITVPLRTGMAFAPNVPITTKVH